MVGAVTLIFWFTFHTREAHGDQPSFYLHTRVKLPLSRLCSGSSLHLRMWARYWPISTSRRIRNAHVITVKVRSWPLSLLQTCNCLYSYRQLGVRIAGPTRAQEHTTYRDSGDRHVLLHFWNQERTHRARKDSDQFPFCITSKSVRAHDTEPPVSHYRTCPYTRAGWLPPRQIVYCSGVESQPAHRR